MIPKIKIKKDIIYCDDNPITIEELRNLHKHIGTIIHNHSMILHRKEILKYEYLSLFKEFTSLILDDGIINSKYINFLGVEKIRKILSPKSHSVSDIGKDIVELKNIIKECKKL